MESAAAPAPKAKSHRVRNIVIGVVVVVVVLGVVGALGSKSGGSASPTRAAPTGAAPTSAAVTSAPQTAAAAAPTAAPTSESGVKVVAIGEPQQVNDKLQVTVEDIQSPASVKFMDTTQTPSPGNSYLFVKVRYDALQDGASYASADWQAYANHQAAGPALIMGDTPTPALVIGTITKGNFAEGWLYYEVPKGSQVALQYKENIFDSTPTFEVDYTAP